MAHKKMTQPSGRYSVSNFKTTHEKKVPFEDLDYTIYKNGNLVVFNTSEKNYPAGSTF
jgi:hypothetical protein